MEWIFCKNQQTQFELKLLATYIIAYLLRIKKHVLTDSQSTYSRNYTGKIVILCGKKGKKLKFLVALYTAINRNHVSVTANGN